jgi:hypothetical protein
MAGKPKSLGAITTLSGGTIQDFNKRLKQYEAMGADFVVTTQGMSRRIYFPDDNMQIKFFGSRVKEGTKSIRVGPAEGAYFVPMVRRAVDSALAAGKVVPKIKYHPDVQQFNHALIKKSIGKNITGIDINACYWTTAYNLGYINKELYDKGIARGKKMGLLIAIGCLNKRPMIEKYKDGKRIDQDWDDDYHLKYSPVYWHIIHTTWQIMCETFLAIGHNHWYMWLTDCVYVDRESEAVVCKLFEEKGYSFKKMSVSFVGYQGSTLNWLDHATGNIKPIGTSNRDIFTEVAEFQKQSKRKAIRKKNGRKL